MQLVVEYIVQLILSPAKHMVSTRRCCNDAGVHELWRGCRASRWNGSLESFSTDFTFPPETALLYILHSIFFLAHHFIIITMGPIPDSFLREAPPNASIQPVDFMHTTPPIPAYKGHFAAVIDNFMGEAECKELLRLAEASTHPDSPDSTPIWEPAGINMGGGRQGISTDTRKSGRIIWDSPEMAQRLLDRLTPFLRTLQIDRVDQPLVLGLGAARRGEVLRLSRLNERLKFLRYEGGDYFRPHWDGCYATPDGSERSAYTIHLYLNGEGEQDLAELLPAIERAEKGDVDSDMADTGTGHVQTNARQSLERSNGTLLGGATSFMDRLGSPDAVRVFPKTGSALIFQQRNLLHSGDDVFRGVKYTMRADMLYTTEQGEKNNMNS